MFTTRSWIAAALLLALLAGCAAQPAPTPTPGASGGKEVSYTGPAEHTGEPVLKPTVSTAESGSASIQTPYPGTETGNGATPTPVTGADQPGQPTEPPVLTLESSGQTLTLKPGDTFLLKLGEGYDWQVIIADQSVVSRVKNVMVIRGAQGLYSALQPGQTEFSAQGDPACRSAKPACAQPSVLFRQTIIVQ